ncbi:peptidoglycan recognition protein family protein [Micromonospora haikouensis]|uniref:peptidoglycan recognition protein family protein n=1 Tax=Micromonospora haikouensis TaxID=686309 RepID=UPI003D70D365
MTRLNWLPEVLRTAGLTVHEYDGREHDGKTWKNRGSDSWGPIEGITVHETRGSRTSTDAGELRVLVTGSSSAPPPIAQLYLSRSGEWWVVASGRCNHNLVGWSGPNEGLGNSRLLGIEAQHAQGEPWTAVQYDSYARGVAALVRKLGISVGRVAGHKEHQPWPAPAGQTSTKSDPEFDMTKFRAAVAAELAGGDDVKPSDQLKIAGWGPKTWPDDKGLADGQVSAETAWGGAYLHSRLAQERTAELRTMVEALTKLVGGQDATAIVAEIRDQHERTRAAVDALDLDEPEIVAGVLAGLSPDRLAAALAVAGLTPAAIAAAVPPDMARKVVDELTARLAA